MATVLEFDTPSISRSFLTRLFKVGKEGLDLKKKCCVIRKRANTKFGFVISLKGF